MSKPDIKKAKTVFIFSNGNVAVTDEKGNQIVKHQGSLYDYKYARKLAKVIVRDNPEVNEQEYFFPLHDYIKIYREHPKLLK